MFWFIFSGFFLSLWVAPASGWDERAEDRMSVPKKTKKKWQKQTTIIDFIKDQKKDKQKNDRLYREW